MDAVATGPSESAGIGAGVQPVIATARARAATSIASGIETVSAARAVRTGGAATGRRTAGPMLTPA